MALRPTKYPLWATDGGTTLEPSSGQKAAGFAVNTKPPARWFNWLLNLIYSWIAWTDERLIFAILSNWTAPTSTFTADDINCGAHSGTRYVIVGNAAKLASSEDGKKWTARTSQFTADNIEGVMYANGLFVAVGAAGKGSTSTDGRTWTARTMNAGADVLGGLRGRAMAYGAGLYVVGGAAGRIVTSPDGTTWTSQTSNFGANQVNSITWNGSLFVAAGAGGKISTSTDGVTWTARTSNTAVVLRNAVYANSLWVVSGVKDIVTSPDGTTWTLRTTPYANGQEVDGLVYFTAAGLWVTAGGGDAIDNGVITTSPDAITWTKRTDGFPGTVAMFDVLVIHDRLVVFGAGGMIVTSPDGITWIERSSGTSANFVRAVASGNQVVACGEGGGIASSFGMAA